MRPLPLLIIATCGLLMLQPRPAAGQSSNLRVAYESLRDAMYNEEPLQTVELLYRQAGDELASAFVGPRERNLWASRLEYMMGRAYKVREKKSAAAVHYEQGLAFAEKAMAGGAFSEGWRMMSENISQLCLVKDLGFILANGLKVSEYAEEALRLDPRNVAARIILAAAKVYPPAVFGGNPKTGIAMMQQILELEPREKDDLFNIYSGIGLAHSKLGQAEEARDWFRRALDLYPGNGYVNEEYRKVAD